MVAAGAGRSIRFANSLNYAQTEAKAKLVSVLNAVDEADANDSTPAPAATAATAAATVSSTPTGASRRNGIDHILNDADAETVGVAVANAPDDETKAAVLPATGQKRKRAADDATAGSPGGAAQGFFVRGLVERWMARLMKQWMARPDALSLSL